MIKGGIAMTMSERLRFLRKDILGLTQEDFAKRIDVSTSNIGGLEIGRTNLTERVIKSICAAFGANEEWLRSGIGEPILNSEKHLLYQLKEYFDLDDIDIDIVMTYVRLPLKYREIFRNYIKLIIDHENNVYISDLENKLENLITQSEDDSEDAERYADMAREQRLSEKKPESQISSAKESDAG
jgi:transcriptional regulator with XRE-family HTH domain